MRQLVKPSTHTSGAAASTAPALPSNMVKPVMVPKWRSRNQSALILSNDKNMNDTPSPTSSRPIEAVNNVSANPNNNDPMPAITPPSATMRRTPRVSTSTPVGTCISV